MTESRLFSRAYAGIKYAYAAFTYKDTPRVTRFKDSAPISVFTDGNLHVDYYADCDIVVLRGFSTETDSSSPQALSAGFSYSDFVNALSLATWGQPATIPTLADDYLKIAHDEESGSFWLVYLTPSKEVRGTIVVDANSLIHNVDAYYENRRAA